MVMGTISRQAGYLSRYWDEGRCFARYMRCPLGDLKAGTKSFVARIFFEFAYWCR